MLGGYIVSKTPKVVIYRLVSLLFLIAILGLMTFEWCQCSGGFGAILRRIRGEYGQLLVVTFHVPTHSVFGRCPSRKHTHSRVAVLP